MTPNIEDAIQFAVAQSGKPYHAFGARFGLDYYDCSGLVIRSLDEAHVPLPPGISVINEEGNTVSLYKWAQSVGGLVSVAKGVATRGAIMIKGKWYGNGPLGHTSISLGNGQEMAAHGTFSGIHISDIYGGRNYQDAFIIPGVHYAALDPPVDPNVIKALEALARWEQALYKKPLIYTETNYNIGILNRLLKHRAYLASNDKSGDTYTTATRQAVKNFKVKTKQPNRDGTVFGGPAATALLKPG